MARLRRLLPIAAALVASCAHPSPAPRPPEPAPAPPAAPDPLVAIRADVEALLAAQGEILWRSWTAGQPGDPASALEGRERVLAPESLARVQEAAARAAGDERRALELLRAFLVGERLGHETAASGGRLARARAQAALTWEGREIAARKASALLAQEEDAGRRALIERALAQAEGRWRPLAEAHRRAVDAAARALGTRGALALAASLRGESPEALAARAEEALDATADPYRALMEDLSRRELGLPLERLRGRDLPRLFALAQEPRAFPADKAAGRALATLHLLGIDLEGRPGVTLDLGPRPGKDPRPLLLPVEVPGSVRVSWAPADGVAEARGVLRTFGGAAFYAEVKAATPEFRRLGGVALDAWGGLFEELAGDPVWLTEQTGLSGHSLEPVVRAAAARRLHGLREAAARLLLELARGAGPPLAPARVQALCQRAFAHPVEAEEAALFAAEPDPLLYSADALASTMLAAQAEAWLARQGGPAWWRAAASGAALRAALAEGSRRSPEELSRSFGFERLDAGALAAAARARGAWAGVRFDVRHPGTLKGSGARPSLGAPASGEDP
jgi:hypothetical protein